MKKTLFLAIGILSMASAISWAQPPGCFWEGDPALLYGWGATSSGWPGYAPPPGNYHQPGNDTVLATRGAVLEFRLGPCNAPASWLPAGCHASDTLCFKIDQQDSWGISYSGQIMILGPGYYWTENVTISVPTCAVPGTYNRIIARVAYTKSTWDGWSLCEPACGDCHDPDYRPLNQKYYYSADTLWVRVDTATVLQPCYILQDSLTLIESGKSRALIPFGICNNDLACPGDYGYHISSKGHVGPPISVSDTISLASGKCLDVYGIVNAGAAVDCSYDTLQIVVWTVAASAAYDTCIQIVHVVKPRPVPLFTLPVATILVLVSIFAAAIFMRRQAACRRA